MWLCPAAQYVSADISSGFLGGGVDGIFSYVMDLDIKLRSSVNNGVVGNAPYWPNMPKMGSVRYASSQVFMFDATFSPTLEGGRNSGTYPAARWDYFPQRHNLGGIICFLDGHASYYKYKYIYNTAGGRVELMNPDVWWDPNRDK
jgi:prepilin-type processing-associated H-X9-DG protein